MSETNYKSTFTEKIKSGKFLLNHSISEFLHPTWSLMPHNLHTSLADAEIRNFAKNYNAKNALTRSVTR